jgi:hypothetical protein
MWYIGSWLGYFLKLYLYDATLFISKLPFGNIASAVYFATAISLLKNMAEGGEFTRVLFRAFHLYFVKQLPLSGCMWRLWSYIGRIMEPTMHIVWKYTGEPLKRGAKDFVMEHSELIKKSVVEMAKTSAFATLVSAVSKDIIAHLGPVAFEAYAKSEIAKTILDIHQNTGRIDTILDTVQMQNNRIEYVAQSLEDNLNLLSLTTANEQYLLENGIAVNGKLAEISMQIEYLRVMQPSKLDRILNTVSISNIFATIANIDITNSASQLGRKRLENGE